MMDEAALFKQT